VSQGVQPAVETRRSHDARLVRSAPASFSTADRVSADTFTRGAHCTRASSRLTSRSKRIAAVLVDEIPLVERDDEGTARFDHCRDDALILFDRGSDALSRTTATSAASMAPAVRRLA